MTTRPWLRVAFWVAVVLLAFWARGQVKREHRLARQAEVGATDAPEREEQK